MATKRDPKNSVVLKHGYGIVAKETCVFFFTVGPPNQQMAPGHHMRHKISHMAATNSTKNTAQRCLGGRCDRKNDSLGLAALGPDCTSNASGTQVAEAQVLVPHHLVLHRLAVCHQNPQMRPPLNQKIHALTVVLAKAPWMILRHFKFRQSTN